MVCAMLKPWTQCHHIHGTKLLKCVESIHQRHHRHGTKLLKCVESIRQHVPTHLRIQFENWPITVKQNKI
jgi:hypothetical protein